jgi:hypothetical protein
MGEPKIHQHTNPPPQLIWITPYLSISRYPSSTSDTRGGKEISDPLLPQRRSGSVIHDLLSTSARRALPTGTIAGAQSLAAPDRTRASAGSAEQMERRGRGHER